MQTAIVIIIFVIVGAVIANLAGLLGKNFFKFSAIYECFLKTLKKTR